MVHNAIEFLNFDMKFIVFCAYIVIIPLFFFLGVTLSRIQIIAEYKYNIFTILFGLVPVGIILPFYMRYEEYQSLLQYPLVLAPFSMLLWAFLSTLESQVLYNWALMLVCLGLALPLGFILPLGLEKYISESQAYALVGILLIFPSVALGYFLYFKISEIRRLNSFERSKEIKSWTCYYPSLFLIMILFILSEGSLVYMYSSQSNNSSALGAVIGMIGVLVLIYVVSSITMQLKLDLPDMRRNNTLKLKVQISFCVFCSVLVPICIIIAFAVDSIGEQFTTSLTTVAASLLFLSIIGLVLIQVKYSNQKLGNLLIIIANVTLWLFLVIPLGVVLPSALSQANTSKKRNQIIGIATVFLGLVFMIGVSLVSIIYNIYKKRMEKEEIAIYCVDQTKKVLNSNFIKVENKTVRNFYDLLAFHNFKIESFTDVIKEEKIYTFIDSINRNRNSNYAKEFLLTAALKSRSRKSVIEEPKISIKPVQNKPSFWMLLNFFESYTDEIQPQILESDESIEEEPEFQEPEPQPVNDLFIFDEDELDVISDSYVDKMRPPFINFRLSMVNNSEIPVVTVREDKSKKAAIIKNIAMMRNKQELKIDRSKRRDWLGLIFDVFAKEPNEDIKEPWMSEASLFYFIRIGGLDSQKVPDQEIKIFYVYMTMAKIIRPLNKKLFITELVPWLSQKMFPELEVLQREELFVIDVLYPSITKNYSKMLEDQSYWEIIEKKDILQNTIEASRLDEEHYVSNINDPRIYLFSSEREPIIEIESNESPIKIKRPKCADKFKRLVFYFNKLGKKITNYGINTSKKLENMLQKQYSLEKKEEKKADETKDKDLSRKTTIIQIKDYNHACSIMIEAILSAKEKKEESTNKTVEKINMKSAPNLMAIFSKIIEFIQLAAIGFKKEVSWSFFNKPLAKVSDSALIENNKDFLPVFWISFSLAALYCPLAWQSWKRVSMNRLGRDETGAAAKFFSIENLKKRYMAIIGSLCYMFILKSQLSVFACDTNTETETPVLWNTDIKCYESFHIAHFFAALLCIFAYYPIATFIFPMLQFTDPNLDLRFETTFVVLLSQIKLFITGITVFLPYSIYLGPQLAIASVALLFLFLYSAIRKPCIARKFNIWLSLGYFFAFITNVLGFVNYLLEGSLFINFAYYGICALALIVVIIIHCIQMKKFRVKKFPSSSQVMNMPENLEVEVKVE